MNLSNVVVYSHLNCCFDLYHLCQQLKNTSYKPSVFKGLTIRHKLIGGTCFCFSSGKIVSNGYKNVLEAKESLRKYSRLIQKFYPSLHVSVIKVATISAHTKLSKILKLHVFSSSLKGSLYEPELFPAVRYKQGKINYSFFHSGKVVITGIKSIVQINNIVKPFILSITNK